MNEANNIEGLAGVRKFQTYSVCKDSGVDWIGVIPAFWEVKPLKHLTAFTTGWTPPTGREDFYGGNHLWANISDLGPKVLCSTEKSISDAAVREARLRIVTAGSLLFSFKLSVGTVSIAGVDMYTNEAIAAFAPSERIDISYLYWAAPVLVPRNAQENIYGAPLLNRERIASALLLSPPLREQRTIAGFLDRKTAKIDTLVAKKERLIDLLQEKRTALNTRAVTKGLDPNVPIKDSGVEWLGEIPAHWKVVRVKYTLKDRISGPFGSSLTKESYGGDTYRVYGQEQVIPGDFTIGDYYIPEAKFRTMTRYAVAPGDVLLSCVGTFGRAAVVPEGIEPGIINPRLILLRPDRGVIAPDYLELFLKSELAYAQMDELTRGGTMDIINLSTISALIMPLPPRAEQEEILKTIRAESSKLDKLLARIRDAINRLKELRTALISAAVTGKFDVREEVA